MITEKLGRFAANNTFWLGLSAFRSEDKQLSELKDLKFQHRFSWLDSVRQSGVYLIFGGRQIGKSTSLKQFIDERLSEENFLPTQVFYLPCDLLIDRVELESILRTWSSVTDRNIPRLLVIDEVTYVKKWDLVIKGLIDEGNFKNTIVIITGSDRILLEDATASFPGVGRRGIAGRNFILCPLTFSEFYKLVYSKGDASTGNQEEELFERYLICGGYLPAINALFSSNAISDLILDVYEQWLIGDIVRRGYDRRIFLDLLRVLFETYGSQLSFSKISERTVSTSSDTVISYLDYLERIGLTITLPAFDQNSLSGLPKKARRFHFRDPFLAHVIEHILTKAQLISAKDKIKVSDLVESAVVGNYASKNHPLYYIKAEGEVDLVEVVSGDFTAIEIKWSKQLRPEDLKQVIKYGSRGLILAKQPVAEFFSGVPIEKITTHLNSLDRDKKEIDYSE